MDQAEQLAAGDGESIALCLLPENYSYHVLQCNVVEVQTLSFYLEVRVNVESVDGVTQFLSDFNASSGCTFNQQSGRPDRKQDNSKSRSRIRGFRKCCMNIKDSVNKENLQPGKNTKCEAKFNFRLENPGSTL